MAHVQGFGLKAIAVVYRRLTNSPATREKSRVAVFVLRELVMGYWEQVGKENRKRREKRAAMNPLRRKLCDALGTTFVFATSFAFWAIVLASIVFWLFS